MPSVSATTMVYAPLSARAMMASCTFGRFLFSTAFHKVNACFLHDCWSKRDYWGQLSALKNNVNQHRLAYLKAARELPELTVVEGFLLAKWAKPVVLFCSKHILCAGIWETYRKSRNVEIHNMVGPSLALTPHIVEKNTIICWKNNAETALCDADSPHVVLREYQMCWEVIPLTIYIWTHLHHFHQTHVWCSHALVFLSCLQLASIELQQGDSLWNRSNIQPRSPERTDSWVSKA